MSSPSPQPAPTGPQFAALRMLRAWLAPVVRYALLVLLLAAVALEWWAAGGATPAAQLGRGLVAWGLLSATMLVLALLTYWQRGQPETAFGFLLLAAPVMLLAGVLAVRAGWIAKWSILGAILVAGVNVAAVLLIFPALFFLVAILPLRRGV